MWANWLIDKQNLSLLRLFKNLTESVSQSVSQKTDEFAVSRIFLFVFYRRSRVFLWVAGADIACLSVDDANGAL